LKNGQRTLRSKHSEKKLLIKIKQKWFDILSKIVLRTQRSEPGPLTLVGSDHPVQLGTQTHPAPYQLYDLDAFPKVPGL
jgi:hypothetical protein